MNWIKFYTGITLVVCMQNILQAIPARLATSEDLELKIETATANFEEGSPILLTCYVINNTLDSVAINVSHLDRKKMLAFRTIHFTIITSDDEILTYQPYSIGSTVATPLTLRTLQPGDTVYFNAILAQGLFKGEPKHPKETRNPNLPEGQYKIVCSFKNYSMESYDSHSHLVLHSDSLSFYVSSISDKENRMLGKLHPYLNEFFGFLEEVITPENIPAALEAISFLRKSESYLSIYADFIFIGMHAWSHDDIKLTMGINEAKKFIAKYHNSLLSEEIEYLLVTMIYRKEGKSEDFYKEAYKVMQRYPKNINNFEVKRLLEER